ncbi:MAG: hypothetical protein EHM89_00695 [Acidobacteria bacterium]|nr:MAG: hypothetical protein EHM89_00695 [Acidobacteriota bacterium]
MRRTCDRLVAQKRFVLVLLVSALSATQLGGSSVAAQERATIEYRVLATNKTSTMERELNEATEAGYRFQTVMGGETSFGGNEVVVVMSRATGAKARFAYRLLATSKTSTMQKELQGASDAGFHYRGQTVFETALGGHEIVVILERDKDVEEQPYEYKLIATSRTGTLQKELVNAGTSGFEIVGMTVSKTALGGSELVTIMRRLKTP